MSTALATEPNPTVERVRRAERRRAAFADEYTFAPHFLDVGDGVHLHYVDEGPRDAPVLLCVHGNPTWSFYFRRVVRAFSTHHRVIALDHVGCGLSDQPEPYPYVLERHVQNLERLVLELDLRAVTLVLHDWGGAIGMGFARRHPERVARLVLGNTAAFRSDAMPLRIAACRWPLVGPLLVRGLGAFSRAALLMAQDPTRSTRAVRRAYLAPHRAWSERAATLAFVRDIPTEAGHPSWDELVATEESLSRFAHLPTLIVWGERDWCFTPAFREEWQRRFPDARVCTLPWAGHWVLEDAPEDVLDAMRTFLAETR